MTADDTLEAPRYVCEITGQGLEPGHFYVCEFCNQALQPSYNAILAEHRAMEAALRVIEFAANIDGRGIRYGSFDYDSPIGKDMRAALALVDARRDKEASRG